MKKNKLQQRLNDRFSLTAPQSLNGKYFFSFQFLLLLFFFLVTGGLFGKTHTRTTIKPYGAYMNYQRALFKNWAYSTGGYLYLGYGTANSFELDGSFTHFDIVNTYLYIDSDGNPVTLLLNDFNQKDFTLVYTNYSLNRLKMRTGLHYLLTDDETSNGSFALILGLNRYAPYYYSIGVDLFASFYRNNEPQLTVYQASPYAGYYFGDYFSYGSFYLGSELNFIYISQEIGWNKTTFLAAKPSLTYYYKKLSLTGYLWLGSQTYALRNGGFVLMYLPEKWTGGWGVSATLQPGTRFSFSLKISRENFEELFNPARANVLTALTSFGITF